MRTVAPYRSPNLVLWLAALTLLAAGLIAHVRYLQGRRAQEQVAGAAPAPGAPPEGESGVSVEDFAPKHYQQGRLAWALQLGRVHLSTAANEATAFELKDGVIYDQKGVPGVRLSADRIKYDLTKRDFEMTGNVEVASVRGAVITTDKVLWTHTTGMLRAPGAVAVTSPDANVRAAGCDFNTRTEVIECPRDVTITTAKSTIGGRRLVYNLPKDTFELSGVTAAIDVEEARAKLGALRSGGGGRP